MEYIAFQKLKSHLLHVMPLNLWLYYTIENFLYKNRSNLGHTHDHAESWCTKNDAKVVASKVGWKKWHKPIERLHKIRIAPYHNFTTTWLRNFIPSYLTWNRTYLSINFRGFRPGMLPRPYWKEKYQIAPWFSL